MTPRFRFAALVLLALLLPAAASAGINSWTPIGPPGAFGIERLHFADREGVVMYAQTTFSGIWRSEDRGESWAPLGVYFYAIAADPRTPGVVYGALSRDFSPTFWRSEDFGSTWREVVQVQELPIDIRNEIVVGPGALYWHTGPSVIKSTDGGQIWECFLASVDICSSPLPAVSAFAADPADPLKLYAVAENVLYRTTDGGATWSGLSSLPLGGVVIDRLVATVEPGLLYAWSSTRAAAACLARSDDGGLTWTALLVGEACSEPAISAESPNVIQILAGPENRLWTSRNRGDEWDRQGVPAPIQGHVFLPPSPVLRVFVAGPEGLFMTPDGGSSWRSASRGLQASDVVLLESSPEAPGVLYAASARVNRADDSEWFLHKSTDAGRTWTALPLRHPTALAIDPDDPQHLFAAALSFHPDRLARSRIFESRNGGRSWTDILERNLPRLNTNYTGHPRATLLVVDPRDSRTLYLGTIFSGLLKSTDGGRTWRPANRGLKIQKVCDARVCPNLAVTDLVVDPFDPRVLYLNFENQLYRSEDGGETWQWASRGIARFGVGALAADPNRPGTLWAVVVASPGTPFQAGAVYRSVDRGRTWAPAGGRRQLPGAPILTDIAATPAGIFVSSTNAGVLRSVDGGRTWTPVNQGLPNVSVKMLEPAALDPDRLFAGTYALGAYSADFP